MRQIIALVFVIITVNAFGQVDCLSAKNVAVVNSINPLEIVDNDTTIRISYVNCKVYDKSPAYYVNGNLFNEVTLKTIKQTVIDSIEVVKVDVEADGKRNYGQIRIKLQNRYSPMLISLSDLKLKYTEVKSESSVFMIDDEVVYGDYRKYYVDKKNILSIVVNEVAIKKDSLQMYIIRLLTKTEDNIRKSKQVMIRGVE
jgi:hypothetical protein